MFESEITVIGTPDYGIYGDYLIKIARIPTNVGNPNDQELVKTIGFEAVKKYFSGVLESDFEIKSLEHIVSFHIGGNYADLRGTFKVSEKKQKSNE